MNIRVPINGMTKKPHRGLRPGGCGSLHLPLFFFGLRNILGKCYCCCRCKIALETILPDSFSLMMIHGHVTLKRHIVPAVGPPTIGTYLLLLTSTAKNKRKQLLPSKRDTICSSEGATTYGFLQP